MSKGTLPYGQIGAGNGKMPGSVYSITATACPTGSKLAKIAGTPCHGCYALRLERMRPTVHAAYRRNLDAWQMAEREGSTRAWSISMAEQIVYLGAAYHRWFDFGDLQSVAHLLAIVDVCELTPTVQHWLPTQERAMVREYRRMFGAFPNNLVVRISASKIDGPLPTASHASVVASKDKKTGAYSVPPGATLCAARTRGNKCGPCRACWDPTVETIVYPKH
jgi:hypothetical protein